MQSGEEILIIERTLVFTRPHFSRLPVANRYSKQQLEMSQSKIPTCSGYKSVCVHVFAHECIHNS